MLYNPWFWLWLVGFPAVLAYLFFLCGTFLEEGTGKLVLYLGAYYRTVIAKKGHTVNEKDDIVDGEEFHPLGGWRWVGWWPFFYVFEKETFRWTKTKPDDSLEDKTDHNVSKLLVRYYVYGIKSDDAEDKNLMPVHSLWSVTAWTKNLKKAWLDTEDWFGAVRGRFKPYIRHCVSLYTYEELVKSPDIRLDRLVEEKLRAEGIIGKLSDDYGFEIVAIECVDISPDEKFRVDTLKKWEAEREAEKRKLERKGSTTGALVEMLADLVGDGSADDIKSIKAEFKADPNVALEKYKGLIEMNKEFIVQQMALDAGSLRRYYFNGAQGGMDLIALLGDVFHGGGGNPGGNPAADPSAPSAPPLARFRKGRGKQGQQDSGGNPDPGGGSGKKVRLSLDEARKVFKKQFGYDPNW